MLKVAELVMVLAVAVVEVVAVVVVEVEAGAATLARERLTHHMTPHARPALRGLRGDVASGGASGPKPCISSSLRTPSSVRVFFNKDDATSCKY